MDLKETFQTIQSRENFLRGLAILATMDSIIDENEKIFFSNAAIGLDIPVSSIQSIATILDMSPEESINLPLSFDNKIQSITFLKEAIQLSYIDGSYSAPERMYLNNVAKSLGIPQNSVDELETWVIECMNWSRKGDDLITKLGVS